MLDIGGEWNTPSDSMRTFLLDSGALLCNIEVDHGDLDIVRRAVWGARLDS